ncbi:hypothetical protein P389DRAFT_66464 [Cystobasidium minutum MCA 4210]|uniref:uncharacterized protein n=1 Tax=Cystobasidium minutum MCA 4210 TaxID=1397322 RepID=UPI0034CE293E|eukprot:jgi/Rhomi1/66464/CE66463_182
MAAELPPEVLCLIFHFVVDDPLGHNRPALGGTRMFENDALGCLQGQSIPIERDSYRTLVGTSLVCRQWTQWAQYVLYKQVYLPSPLAVDKFLDTIGKREDLARKALKLAINVRDLSILKGVVETLHASKCKQSWLCSQISHGIIFVSQTLFIKPRRLASGAGYQPAAISNLHD